MGKYFRYTPAMLEYIKNNVAGTPFQMLTENFNKEFGSNVTRQQLAALARRKGWCNGLFHAQSVFPQHIRDFMEAHCAGRRGKEMAQLLNETFGTSYTPKQISAYYRKHGLRSGVAGRYVPIGTLIFRPGQWYYEKVADGPDPNKNWRSKHVLVWEAVHGPVPEGYMVIFLDGDRKNYSIENLTLCPYDIGMEMNKKKLRFSSAQATETGMMIAKLSLETRRRQKKRSGGK